VIEPPVCEPSAPRHMPVARAAAEPLLDPPGVRSTFHGLRVTGGSKLANNVVTVLPRKTAPACRRASGGWPVENVKNVLDADGDAVHRPAIFAFLDLVRHASRLGPRAFPIDGNPGGNLTFPAVDLGQALVEDIERSGLSFANGVGGGVKRRKHGNSRWESNLRFILWNQSPSRHSALAATTFRIFFSRACSKLPCQVKTRR